MMQRDNYFTQIRLVAKGQIAYAGNKRLKIYGRLTCASGKRMKKDNRVFFSAEQEAIDQGYRPCGHCMREKYKEWKNGQRGSLQATARK